MVFRRILSFTTILRLLLACVFLGAKTAASGKGEIPHQFYRLPVIGHARERVVRTSTLLEPLELRIDPTFNEKGSDAMCEGACISSRACKYYGGSAQGLCINDNVCCRFERSCAGISREKISFFTSPGYPNSINKSLECSHLIYPNDGVCSLRVDFIELKVARGIKYTGGVHKCLEDNVYFLNTLNPPHESICDFENYSAILPVTAKSDKPVTIHFVIQSEKMVRWKIRVTQINCRKLAPWKNEPNCGNQLLYSPPSVPEKKKKKQANKSAQSKDSSSTTPLAEPSAITLAPSTSPPPPPLPTTTPSPESQPFPTSQPPKPEPSPEPEAASKPEPLPEPEAAPKPQALATTQATPSSEPEPESEPSPEPEPESKTESPPTSSEIPSQNTMSLQNPKARSLFQVSPFIVNGDDIASREFPWHANIRVSNAHRCGASIINKHFLLTAAHCFSGRAYDPIEKMTAIVGLSDDEEDGQEYGVKHVFINFDYKSFKNHKNDIAIVQLDSPIIYNEAVQPICLPDKDYKTDGKEGWVTGSGRLNATYATLPTEVQKLNMRVIPNAECKQSHREELIKSMNKSKNLNSTLEAYDFMGNDNTHVCAIGIPQNTTVCFGDSGGPLVVEDGGKWSQIGVVSYGLNPCDVQNRLPLAFTRVSEFLQFIAIVTTSDA